MRARLIAAGLVALSIVYLAFFVSRGWIPHDEGMTGQSAERVLSGETPHVDYEEPYTGGLVQMHALVFRLAGVDLIYPRLVLFAGAVLAQVLIYLILSRYLQPIGAALGAWLALGCSALGRARRHNAAPSGLEPIETRYLFQSLVAPKLLVRLAEGLRHSAPSLPRVPTPAVNRALQTWFRAENAVAGWLPFGSSVMAVASVPAR